LKEVWNKPEELYGAIVMALGDEFFAEVLDATKQLKEIDPETSRSYNVLGLTYLKNKMLTEAEQTLNEGIKKSDYKAVMTTNLAKVYVEQGLQEKAMQTLWEGIKLDPNQDNGLEWFSAIEYEKGGDTQQLEAFKKIASLPKSWRAKLYVARHYLEQKEFDKAKNIYKEILEIANNEPDAIWVITGDLGLNNRIDDIFELIYPVFNVQIHGIDSALNMIQACIQSKRKEEGLVILKEFKKLERYDLLQLTNDLEKQLKNIN
jgi:tetratricopeptide (TPR) repeat protein